MSNHLRGQTSPYLLQHAQQPVDWYPWGQEAFQKARDEDKPIFLSIGYSTCHWCHVMAHESFEDPEIAKLLNENFVPIKVDREERPDIDSLYMTACQAFTEGAAAGPPPSSSPLTRSPFSRAPTSRPPAGGGLMGMDQLLPAICEAWEQDRDALTEPGNRFVTLLRQERASTPHRRASTCWRRAWPSGSGPTTPSAAASASPPSFPWATACSFC